MELHRSGKSYTADTLRELRERYQRMGERDGDTPQGVASEEARECACEERQRDA